MTVSQRTDEFLAKGYDLASAIAAAVGSKDHGRDHSAWHEVPVNGSIQIGR